MEQDDESEEKYLKELIKPIRDFYCKRCKNIIGNTFVQLQLNSHCIDCGEIYCPTCLKKRMKDNNYMSILPSEIISVVCMYTNIKK